MFCHCQMILLLHELIRKLYSYITILTTMTTRHSQPVAVVCYPRKDDLRSNIQSVFLLHTPNDRENYFLIDTLWHFKIPNKNKILNWQSNCNMSNMTQGKRDGENLYEVANDNKNTCHISTQATTTNISNDTDDSQGTVNAAANALLSLKQLSKSC